MAGAQEPDDERAFMSEFGLDNSCNNGTHQRLGVESEILRYKTAIETCNLKTPYIRIFSANGPCTREKIATASDDHL